MSKYDFKRRAWCKQIQIDVTWIRIFLPFRIFLDLNNSFVCVGYCFLSKLPEVISTTSTLQAQPAWRNWFSFGKGKSFPSDIISHIQQQSSSVYEMKCNGHVKQLTRVGILGTA